MIKCPFCGFDNEEGALFCEQCKSDLSGVESSAVPAAEVAEAIPFAEAEAVMAEVVEATPVDDVPMAIAAEAVEAIPMEEAIPEPPPAAKAPEPPPAPPAPPPPAAAPAAPAAPAAAAQPLPAGAEPRLVVIRGQKVNVEFPIYPDLNFIGRSDEKPVDIDLDDQEPPDRVWCSRQHAVILFEDNKLTIEDLNSANGTYVNRVRVHPGDKKPLNVGDVVQIGTVHLKLKV